MDLAFVGRNLERAANLSQYLGLSNDHRVDAGCNLEQMPYCRFVVVGVEIVGEVLGGDMGDLTKEVPQVLSATMELGDVGIDLDPIAGRQHHSLDDMVVGSELMQRLNQGVARDRQTFQEIEGRGPVVKADDD